MNVNLLHKKPFETALIIWVVSTVLPLGGFGVYLLPVLAIYWMVAGKNKIRLNPFGKGLVFYALLAYLLWDILSLAHTSNLDFGLARFEKRIPLLIVGLFGIIKHPDKKFNTQSVLYAFIVCVALVLVWAGGNTLYKLFWGNYPAHINVYGISHINYFSGIKHYTYLGVELMMGIVLLVTSSVGGNRLHKLIYLLFGVFVLVMIYLSGAKIVLVAGFVIAVFSLAGWMQKSGISIWIKLAAVALVAGFAVLFYFQPRVQNIVSSLSVDKALENVDPRFQTWDSALKVIADNPFAGVGMGDYEDVLLKQYRTDGYEYAFRNKLNTHSQYLQTTVESGIVGLLLLILVFGTVWFKNRNNLIAKLFVLLYATCFITEAMLLRNMGVFTFAFWLLYFGEKSGEKFEGGRNPIGKPKYINSLFVLSILLLIAFWGTAKLVAFSPSNPKTYFASYNSRFKTEPAGIPGLKANAVVVDHTFRFEKDKNTDFIAVPFYRDVDNRKCTVTYEVWCKIENVPDLTNVYAYVYDYNKVSERTYYNLDKPDVWQKLVVPAFEINGRFELGIRIEKSPQSKLNGKVLIAHPRFETR